VPPIRSRTVDHFSERGFRFEERFRNLLRHPAVALAEQADERGPAALDYLEAQGQNLAFGLSLVRNTPAEFHLFPCDAAALAQSEQLWEVPLDQF